VSEAETLILSMGEDGKDAQAIAVELNGRGLRGRGGHVFTPAEVEGFLRFIGANGAVRAPVKNVNGAVWGKQAAAAKARPPEDGDDEGHDSVPRNRYRTYKHFSETQQAEIARLYRIENMSGGDIAKKLGLSRTHLNLFLGSLAGLSVPPGEITEYTDDQGRKILKCPPGWAHGAYPQRNVGGAY
jgi:hypothetical protein